jgi:protein-S-isoprenylcysteine O-methyltransferase Ste14
MVETARYVVGCLLVIGLPPGMAWWFVVHPFIEFWRRVGVKQTFVIGTTLALLSTIPLYLVRDAMLMSDLGTSWIMVGVAGVLIVGAILIAVKRQKHLTMKILAGAPELERGGKGGTLLTEGAYSVTRNPRYIETIVVVFAYAAFSNYLGAYLMALVTVPVVHLIVILEERELRDRFGDEYEAYVTRVPRYIPRGKGSVEDSTLGRAAESQRR